MTQQEYNNQGFQDAATRQGYSPVLAELEMVNERCALESAQQKTLTAYNVRPADPLPYDSPGEALTDLVSVLAETAVKLAPPVGKLAAIAGAGYFALSAIGGACAMAKAWGAANATMIGAGLVGVVAVWVAKSSIQDKRANAGGQTTNSAPAQNINVTVNVAGQNVTNGTK